MNGKWVRKKSGMEVTALTRSIVRKFCTGAHHF
jgi:hypothetical protein